VKGAIGESCKSSGLSLDGDGTAEIRVFDEETRRPKGCFSADYREYEGMKVIMEETVGEIKGNDEGLEGARERAFV
jgi:hypothetical protein